MNRAAFDKAAVKYAAIFGDLSEASRRLVSTADAVGFEAQSLMGGKPEFPGAFEFVEQLRRGVTGIKNTVPEPSSGPGGFDSGF